MEILHHLFCSCKKLHTILFPPFDDVNHFQGGKSSRARGNNIIQEAAVGSPSQIMEGESSLSGQASEYEEAESGRKFWLLVLCYGK
jgi:hypothetical protein